MVTQTPRPLALGGRVHAELFDVDISTTPTPMNLAVYRAAGGSGNDARFFQTAMVCSIEFAKVSLAIPGAGRIFGLHLEQPNYSTFLVDAYCLECPCQQMKGERE